MCTTLQRTYTLSGIERNSLHSILKFVNANYITIFYKDEINIYDANKTTIAPLRAP